MLRYTAIACGGGYSDDSRHWQYIVYDTQLHIVYARHLPLWTARRMADELNAGHPDSVRL